MKGLENKSVMLTSVELGGVGWFTSIISKIHKDMFGKPIRWNYEVSRFEATRVRRPLPRGWCTVWNAKPEDLVKRDYYRVIGLQKSLEDVYYSHALYHRPGTTYNEILEREPWFFNVAKEKWLAMEKDFKHDNYMRFHLDDLNTYTVEFFNKALDFLGFPEEGRTMILPVKVYRNWECYSNVSVKKGHVLRGQLSKIKEMYYEEVLNKV